MFKIHDYDFYNFPILLNMALAKVDESWLFHVEIVAEKENSMRSTTTIKCLSSYHSPLIEVVLHWNDVCQRLGKLAFCSREHFSTFRANLILQIWLVFFSTERVVSLTCVCTMFIFKVHWACGMTVNIPARPPII